MTLEIYNFHWAQGDRIVWVCEELKAIIPNFSYKCHVFARGGLESEGKQKLLSLHPSGTAPTMVDSNVSPPITISESQAILMYILSIYGEGHFQMTPSDGPHTYAQYLYWLCFANGSFQAFLTVDTYGASLINAPGFPKDSLAENLGHQSMAMRTPNHLKQFNDRLATNTYLAGETFSAADMMNIYAMTLFRVVYPVDLTDYPHITRWLRTITRRPAYRAAMDVTENSLPALVGPTVPKIDFPILLSMRPWTENKELVALKEEQDKEAAATT